MTVKNFDEWNLFKKALEKSDSNKIYFYEKEIWFCSIGLNIGSEQDSRNKRFSRPVLVLKKCNRHTFIGIPLTSKISDFSDRVQINIGEVKAVVLLSQLRLFDTKRLLRKYHVLSTDDFEKVRQSLKSFLEL